MTEEFKPKRPKTGGRAKGTKNKSTIARQQAVEEALRTIKNANGSGIYDGDAWGLLKLVYSNESFPLDVRTRAAEAALRYERPALAAIDSTAKVEQTYIVRMPEPVKDLDDWKRIYCDNDKPADDTEWQRRLQEIKPIAETKKEGGK